MIYTKFFSELFFPSLSDWKDRGEMRTFAAQNK